MSWAADEKLRLRNLRQSLVDQRRQAKNKVDELTAQIDEVDARIAELDSFLTWKAAQP